MYFCSLCWVVKVLIVPTISVISFSAPYPHLENIQGGQLLEPRSQLQKSGFQVQQDWLNDWLIESLIVKGYFDNLTNIPCFLLNINMLPSTVFIQQYPVVPFHSGDNQISGICFTVIILLKLNTRFRVK